MSKSKIAVPIVALVLLVGAVVGVVVVVKNNKSPKEGQNMSGSMKMITSICEGVSFKGTCARSLESAAKNESAKAQDYILAAVNNALVEVKKALESTSSKVTVDENADKYGNSTIEDCKHLLDYASGTLQDTIQAVQNSTDGDLQEQAHDFLSWLTSVHSMHSICLDQIQNPELKKKVAEFVSYSAQVAQTAVEIVSDMDQVLGLFGINTNESEEGSPAASPSRRRLLMNPDGSPYWFSAADRKLLGKGHKGKSGGGGGSKDDATPYIANVATIKPHVVVAKDGSGQFKTINEALKAYPANNHGRFIIYVKAGIYNENVIIDKSKPNIFMYGDGMGKTIVTHSLSNRGGYNTMRTATFANEAFGFIARGMTFRNEAGPEGHQAVAFRSIGDKVALFDCSFEAYQDTLYYQSNRQYYKNCVIYGTIDFIFGKGDAVIQDSDIIVRRGMASQFNTVTADGRDIQKGSGGLVLHHCRIRPDNILNPVRFQVQSFLGRPWSPESITVTMLSELGDFIRPEGYKIWDGANNHKSCAYYEFGNTGPGAKTAGRDFKNFAKSRVISQQEADRFAPSTFINGNAWLPQTGFPFKLGLNA